MPHFKDVSLTNPTVLQAASNFTRLSEINVNISPTYTHYAIRGDSSRRGACHFQDNVLTSILLRGLSLGNSPSVIRSEVFSDFGDDFVIGPGTAYLNITSLKVINDFLWIVGKDTVGHGKVLAIQEGLELEVPSNYIDRSGDLSSVQTTLSLIRYAKDTGYIYYTGTDTVSNHIRVMRGTTSEDPFTNICATVLTPGYAPTAYGISDSGAIHMMFCSTGGSYKSLDGGVTWSSLVVPLALPITDVTYSKKFNRWAITNGVSSEIYSSTDDGVTWVSSKWVTFPSKTFNSPASITHLERLDVEGRYILAVAGFNSASFARTYTYLSEDGGLNWMQSQVLRVPNYDASLIPANSSLVLVNAGSRVLLYQGNTGNTWNFDNSVFVTPILSFVTP